jgi:alpha-galactosidase
VSKITLIGAGSVVFTRNLCSDILLTPVLQDSTITLMDIDPERLAQAKNLLQAIIDQRDLKARVEATPNRLEALRGADYVITTFQQGGLDAYALDIEIPQKYGVEQCVGDTLGPGGVFRALRTIPVLLDLCREMDEVARPEALLLNYVNPRPSCSTTSIRWQPTAGLSIEQPGVLMWVYVTACKVPAKCWSSGSRCRMMR